ncbi:MAG: hypothetical protein IT245_03305, partial [Bacteroidia bacterium]|nr:hypothetical protein [Bacteroidia bacterium]
MKYSILILSLLISLFASAQSQREIRKAVYKNIKKYRDHHAVYESWYKFQSGEDTSYSVMDIRLYTLIGRPAYSILTNITEYDTIL